MNPPIPDTVIINGQQSSFLMTESQNKSIVISLDDPKYGGIVIKRAILGQKHQWFKREAQLIVVIVSVLAGVPDVWPIQYATDLATAAVSIDRRLPPRANPTNTYISCRRN